MYAEKKKILFYFFVLGSRNSYYWVFYVYQFLKFHNKFILNCYFILFYIVALIIPSIWRTSKSPRLMHFTYMSFRVELKKKRKKVGHSASVLFWRSNYLWLINLEIALDFATWFHLYHYRYSFYFLKLCSIWFNY